MTHTDEPDPPVVATSHRRVRVSYFRRLVLLGLFILLPLPMLTAMLVKNENASVSAATAAGDGQRLVLAVNNVLTSVDAVLQSALTTNDHVPDPATTSALNQAVEDVRTGSDVLGQNSALLEEWDAIEADLARQVVTPHDTVFDAIDAYQASSSAVVSFINSTADEFGIVLADDLARRQLARLATSTLPRLLEQQALVSAYAEVAFDAGEDVTLRDAAIANIAARVGGLELTQDVLQREAAAISASTDEDVVRELVVDGIQPIAVRTEEIFELIESIQTGPEDELAVSLASISSETSSNVGATIDQITAVSEELTDQLDATAARQSDRRRNILIFIIGSALISLTMLFSFYRFSRRTIGSLTASVQSLAGSSEELSTVSLQMAGAASQASSQAESLAGAANTVDQNLQSVAAGSEEMGSSIRNIAESASAAAVVAEEAVQLSTTAAQSVDRLGESTSEISDVVSLISTVAEQTNLLALNATIEAARAGEAGKGFAVVAGEVKELAQQTASATDDIAAKADNIQSSTGDITGIIGRVSEIVERISAEQSSIAAAVEEQTATTAEITHAVTEVAGSSSGIATTVDDVAAAAKSTQSGATDTQAAADELARMASDLDVLVTQLR